ncbi:putative leucine-rich repeat containing protein [Corchorus olitorius]|uniref:Leucine-rich repeat containing protein n=1 Tax=Corchorus olitorius TaxID=93759 RepID=A0A1R3GBE3_9ROSI|nr:putative leucine-rich repeat containing protein [Corchorus olitorius]
MFSFIEFYVSNFKYLRALDLSYSSLLEVLPESIGTLKHLRYLDLRECRHLRKLPSSFYRLVSLQMLNIRYVKLMQLPESIRSLIRLRCLEITAEAEQLRQLIQPGCWSSLQSICFYRCGDLEHSFNCIQYLTSLRTLYVIRSYLRSLPRNLTFLTKLEHLQIDGCHGIDLDMEPAEEEDQYLHLNLRTFSVSESEATKKLPRLLLEGSASTLQCHISWFYQPTPAGCGKLLFHPLQYQSSVSCISFMDYLAEFHWYVEALEIYLDLSNCNDIKALPSSFYEPKLCRLWKLLFLKILQLMSKIVKFLLGLLYT